MAQPVGDLVVNLDVNAAKFTEQLAYARRQLGGLGGIATESAAEMSRAFDRQQLAAQRAGLSVGQYKAAMRTLPAQFTDIATQLAGGQSPWLILMQQGGQIKDSFGGLPSLMKVIQGALFGVREEADDSGESLSDNANAAAENVDSFRTLGGLINPTNLAIGALVVTVGALAYSFLKGQGVLSEFNKALVMTGSRSGQTANNLLFIAENVANSGASFTAAIAALSALTKAGANLGSEYGSVTASITALSDATGTKVSDLAAVFGAITSDPESGLRAMAQQYGQVTVQQLDYVKSLQEAGKYTEALHYANGIAAEGFQDMASKIQNNMGFLESAANAVGDAFKSMWNRLLDIGRQDSLQQQLADATERLYELDKGLRASSAQGQQRLGMENAYQAARQQVSLLSDQLHLEQRKVEEQQKQAEQQKSALINQQYFQSFADAALTKEQQRAQAYQRLNNHIAERRRLNQALSDDEIAQIKKGIEERYKDPKTPKAPGVKVSAGDRAEDNAQAAVLALQTQLKVLQQHTDVNDVISQQRRELWKTENQYTVLEEASQSRQLSVQEKSLLAHKQETLEYKRQLADLGDKVSVQQKLNNLADQASKFAQQQTAQRAGIEAQANGLSSRDAERQSTMQRLQEAYAFNPDAQQKVLAEQEKSYAAQDALRDNWLAGAKKGWAEYQDSASDVFSSVQQISQSTFNGLSERLTSLVTTGKASLKDFTVSILTMITEVTNRLLVAYAVQSAMGWISGSLGSTNSSAASAGNSFSAGAYNNLSFDAGGYTGAGDKYDPAGVVHRGEFVFTKEATNRLGVSNLYRLMRGYATGGYVGTSAGIAGDSRPAPIVNITIQDGKGSLVNAPSGMEGFGSDAAQYVTKKYYELQEKDLGQNGSITKAVRGRR